MSLIEQRTDLATALDGIEKVAGHRTWPARLVAPAAVVDEGTPYLSPSSAKFGGWDVRHEVTVVARPAADNTVATDQLCQLLAATVQALEDAGHDVTEAGGFFPLDVAGTQHLACRVSVTTVVAGDALT